MIVCFESWKRKKPDPSSACLHHDVRAECHFWSRFLQLAHGTALLCRATLNELSYLDAALATNVVVPGKSSRGLGDRFALKRVHGGEKWVSVLRGDATRVVRRGQHMPKLLLLVERKVTRPGSSRDDAQHHDSDENVSCGK